MDRQAGTSRKESVEMTSLMDELLDEALSGDDVAVRSPDGLADRIVARTRHALPRPDVVARIGPVTAAVRWGGGVAASWLIAMSVSLLLIEASGPAPSPPVRVVDVTAEAMADAIDGLEAEIDSLMTRSTWETAYSTLSEELTWWEFDVGDASRMDQF